jgi:hypothetical protein
MIIPNHPDFKMNKNHTASKEALSLKAAGNILATKSKGHSAKIKKVKIKV